MLRARTGLIGNAVAENRGRFRGNSAPGDISVLGVGGGGTSYHVILAWKKFSLYTTNDLDIARVVGIMAQSSVQQVHKSKGGSRVSGARCLHGKRSKGLYAV